MVGRSISGPSSASSKSTSYINYGGSRREAARARYKSRKWRAGVVALASTWVPTAEQLYEWLEDCQALVERVEWQSNKVSQGQVGGYVPGRSIKVFPRRYPAGSATDQFLEFGITCHPRMGYYGCPYTLSVMFKDPPKGLALHAWRILRHICKGKELFPEELSAWDEFSTILLLAHNLPALPLCLMAEFVLPQRHYLLDFWTRR